MGEGGALPAGAVDEKGKKSPNFEAKIIELQSAEGVWRDLVDRTNKLRHPNKMKK